MAMLRKYTSTVNGRLTVIDANGGDISSEYQNVAVPGFGLIDAELEVDSNGTWALKPNGHTIQAVAAAYDLLGLLLVDMGLRKPSKRAF